MPSELKSATARINGAKSRGPKTAATRDKSSLNALNHGFTAHSTVLLQCEDPGLFEKIRAEYLATYQPATPAEEVLVDEMIVARWRIQRLWTIETALFDREVSRQQPEMEKPNAAVNLALAFRALADESYSLGLLSRYESRLQRTHERTYRTLRQLQQERLTPTQPDPPTPPRQEPPDPTKPSAGLSSGSTPGLVNRDRAAAGPRPVPAPGVAQRNCETNPAATPRNPGEDSTSHADHPRWAQIKTQTRASWAAA